MPVARSSCEACRARKLRCSKGPVCTRCASKGWLCVYSQSPSQSKIVAYKTARPRPLEGSWYDQPDNRALSKGLLGQAVHHAQQQSQSQMHPMYMGSMFAEPSLPGNPQVLPSQPVRDQPVVASGRMNGAPAAVHHGSNHTVLSGPSGAGENVMNRMANGMQNSVHPPLSGTLSGRPNDLSSGMQNDARLASNMPPAGKAGAVAADTAISLSNSAQDNYGFESQAQPYYTPHSSTLMHSMAQNQSSHQMQQNGTTVNFYSATGAPIYNNHLGQHPSSRLQAVSTPASSSQNSTSPPSHHSPMSPGQQSQCSNGSSSSGPQLGPPYSTSIPTTTAANSNDSVGQVCHVDSMLNVGQSMDAVDTPNNGRAKLEETDNTEDVGTVAQSIQHPNNYMMRTYAQKFAREYSQSRPTYISTFGADFGPTNIQLTAHLRPPSRNGTPAPSTDDYSFVMSITHDPSQIASKYYGPSCNFSFLSQLSMFLDKIKDTRISSVVKMAALPSPQQVEKMHDSDIYDVPKSSTRDIAIYVEAYFEAFHVLYPIMDPYEWIQYTRSSKFAQNPPGDQNVRQAIVYLMAAMGVKCCKGRGRTIAGPLSRSLGVYLLKEAKKRFPDLSEVNTLAEVQLLLLAAMLGLDNANQNASYMYIGMATRASYMLGYHCLDPAVKTDSESLEAYRTWMLIGHLETYVGLKVGRPSGRSPTPQFVKINVPAFTRTDKYAQNTDIVQLRVLYSDLCGKSINELYNEAAKTGVIELYDKVQALSEQINNVAAKYDPYFSIPQSQVYDMANRLTDLQCTEWFWIRLYYLHLRITLLRPLLVLFAYRQFNSSAGTTAHSDLLSRATTECINVAMEIPDYMLTITDRLDRNVGQYLSSSYIESSCMVLAFFVLSKLHDATNASQTKNLLRSLKQIQEYFTVDDGDPCSSHCRMIASSAAEWVRSVEPGAQTPALEQYSSVPLGPSGLRQENDDFQTFFNESLDWMGMPESIPVNLH